MASSAKYLLDASALYPLMLRMRENLLQYAAQFAVLDLTLYEVGNAIWKEHRKGRIRNLALVAKVFEEIIKDMNRLSIGQEIFSVLEIATGNDVTFYDASYIYVARKWRLKLVTEDSVLLSRFSEATSTEALLKDLGLG